MGLTLGGPDDAIGVSHGVDVVNLEVGDEVAPGAQPAAVVLPSHQDSGPGVHELGIAPASISQRGIRGVLVQVKRGQQVKRYAFGCFVGQVERAHDAPPVRPVGVTVRSARVQW